MKGRVRPGRPLAPIGVAVAVLGTWWLVAHNSGAGWVQALGDLVFGVLGIGIVGPAVVLRRARLDVTHGPAGAAGSASSADAAAGLPVEVTVRASTRLRVRPVEPLGPEGLVGPIRRARARRIGTGTDGTVVLLPQYRGVHDTLIVDIATAAPFGLQWWTRRITLPLPAALHVYPRRGQALPLPANADDRRGDRGARSSAPAGEARGVRPYRPGDNRRHVHWPATAHTGELMVREMEGPSADPVTVAVALPPGRDDAERIAEQAMGTVLALIERGAPVVLQTLEPDGPVVGEVGDRRRAGRRLARAVAGSGGSSVSLR